MNIARQSHQLRKRLEAKYNRKIRNHDRSVERGLFYTIVNNRGDEDVIQYRRHRHIAVH